MRKLIPFVIFISSGAWASGEARFPGGVIGNLTGNVTGTCSLATALASNPADCSANSYATSIDAGGNLSCSTVSDSGLATSYIKADGSRGLSSNWNAGAFTITATTFTGALSGNASTSSALASNPADCGANTYATTIAANGDLTCASITNASTTAASANTPSAIVARDGSGNFVAGTITANLTGAVTGNASTATALASNPSDCSANNYATAIDASGNLTCGTVSDSGLATSYIKADGSRGLSSNWNAGAFTITATTFTGALSGNASTATALASNPSDCSAGQFATAIDASGNLTCSVPAGAGDVTGPGSSVDGGIVVFNSTTGKVIKAGTLTQHNVATGGASNTLSSVAPSTAGNVLASDGTDWASASIGESETLRNVGISATISTNTLVVAIKQADGSTNCSASAPCIFGVRNATATTGGYTNVSLAAASSVTLAATDSIGASVSSGQPLYAYFISDTTSEPCLSTVVLDEGALQSASALTGGADTTAATLWCTNAHTSRPVRMLSAIYASWGNPNWSSVTKVTPVPFEKSQGISVAAQANFGTNCSWTTTSVTLASFGVDATCTFTANTRNSGKLSLAAETSGGNKLPGITFTPSRGGQAYQVCAVGSMSEDTSLSLADIEMVSSDSSSQRVAAAAIRPYLDGTHSGFFPFSLCGQYISVDTSSVSLEIRGSASAGTLSIGALSTESQALSWSVFEIH